MQFNEALLVSEQELDDLREMRERITREWETRFRSAEGMYDRAHLRKVLKLQNRLLKLARSAAAGSALKASNCDMEVDCHISGSSLVDLLNAELDIMEDDAEDVNSETAQDEQLEDENLALIELTGNEADRSSRPDLLNAETQQAEEIPPGIPVDDHIGDGLTEGKHDDDEKGSVLSLNETMEEISKMASQVILEQTTADFGVEEGRIPSAGAPLADGLPEKRPISSAKYLTTNITGEVHVHAANDHTTSVEKWIAMPAKPAKPPEKRNKRSAISKGLAITLTMPVFVSRI
ncbi:hypothetical protein HK101_011839 [Irineochytrium annulatum]|nr:hypothetical protein HK101_011839 [Irineochytrium annulatum]